VGLVSEDVPAVLAELTQLQQRVAPVRSLVSLRAAVEKKQSVSAPM